MAFRNMSTLLKALPKVGPSLSSNPVVSRSAACLSTSSSSSWSPISRPSISSHKLGVFDQTPVFKTTLLCQPLRHEFHLLAKTGPSIFSGFQAQRLEATEAKRTVVKFSLLKGRRKTVKAVVKRFLRLDWGIWIRPKAGRHKHLWRKGHLRKKRIRQHVFTNAWQTKTLDRMTTKYWHKKKYFVDDPYTPYHTRPNFWITKNIKNIKDQFYK